MRSIKHYLLTGSLFTILLSTAAAGQEIFSPNNSDRINRRIMYKLPFTTKAQMINVEIVDGMIIFEGDIILGDASMLNAPQLMSVGTTDRRWPDGIIPFDVSTTHPKYADIMAAIEIVNQKTNLSFIKHTTEKDYVEFIKGEGCSSFFGRKIGRQEVVVGDCSVGNIIHESLHVAGLYHEQNRTDRDNYVTINWENIEPGKENNFTKYTESKSEIFNGSDIGGYDYSSIMHYGTHFFSKNGEPTIVAQNDVQIGQRDHISTGDLRGLRAMYPVKALPPAADTYRMNRNMIQKPRAETYRPGGILRP